MKVITALLSAVPVPFIRARFHAAGGVTTAVQPDTKRLPSSHESWMDEASSRRVMRDAMFRLMMR